MHIKIHIISWNQVVQFAKALACSSALVLALFSSAQALTVYSNPKIRMAVVELYTSEGCSSCPPADKQLSAIGQRENPNILPLAFHVDYWDYLGWKDAFSKAEYTQRQHRLGKINQQNTIYTPEFFINGQESRRSNGSKINKVHQSSPKADLILEIEAQQNDSIDIKLSIHNVANATLPQLFFAISENKLISDIAGGENGGRTLKHDHVVRAWFGPYDVSQQTSITQSFDIDPEWQRQHLTVSAILEEASTSGTLQAISSVLPN